MKMWTIVINDHDTAETLREYNDFIIPVKGDIIVIDCRYHEVRRRILDYSANTARITTTNR